MRTIYVSPEFPLNRRMRKDIRRGKLHVVREGGESSSLGGGIPSRKGRAFRTIGSPLVCMAAREGDGSEGSISPQRMNRMDYFKSSIERDLEAFADAGTVATSWIKNDGDPVLSAIWGQGGQPYPGNQHRFSIASNGSIMYIKDGEEAITYSHFLQRVSELGEISKAMCVNGIPNYVPTRAWMNDNAEKDEVSDKMLLQEIQNGVKEASEGKQLKTNLFFVKGDAGAGKTTLLERLQQEQAKKFSKGEADFLFFYISAQGRALSSLDDAIAGELDELRDTFMHRLSRRGILALARRGLLVPIVDGFDELLGSAGYGDAFDSLGSFLGRLGGEGVMVVSARSAFYETEFAQRISDSNHTDIQINQVSLKGWSEKELFTFLGRHSSDLTKYKKQWNALSQESKDLLSKPFFATEFASYVDGEHSKEFLDFLMDKFIERESEKIVGRDLHPLLQPKSLRSMLIGIAEEMWISEIRDLKISGGQNEDHALRKGDLQSVVGLRLEAESVDPRIIDQIRIKIGHLHGVNVVRNGEKDRFAFEHEVYFEHFLSLMIRDKLLAKSMLNESPSTLDAGEFPAEAVHLAIRDPESVAACLQLADDLSQKEEKLKDNCALNMGRMLASAFAERGKEGCESITIRRMIFRNCDFGKAQLRNIRFVDCEFSGVDLRDCSFEECTMDKNCRVDVAKLLVVSDSTRLGIKGLVPGENLFAICYRGEEIRNVKQIAEIWEKLGCALSPILPPEYSPRAMQLVGLLPRVVGAFRTASTLCKDDNNPHNQSLFSNPAWDDLKTLLCRHQIMVEKTRHRSGPPMVCFDRGIRSMDEIFKYETASDSDIPERKILEFWKAINAMR